MLARKCCVLQGDFSEITANTTNGVTTWPGATLFSRTIVGVGEGNKLQVFFCVSSSNTGGNQTNYFRLLIDGGVIRGTGARMSAANEPAGSTFLYQTAGLTPGNHTVEIQWRVSGGTGQIRPVAAPDQGSASLLIQEIRG